eukprot:3883506-Amphidinium_carterae.1
MRDVGCDRCLPSALDSISKTHHPNRPGSNSDFASLRRVLNTTRGSTPIQLAQESTKSFIEYQERTLGEVVQFAGDVPATRWTVGLAFSALMQMDGQPKLLRRCWTDD